VIAMDTRAIGLTLIDLGGGRRRVEDRIDFRVGLSQMRSIGSDLGSGEPICLLHAASEKDFEIAEAAVRNAVTIGDEPVSSKPVIVERVVV